MTRVADILAAVLALLVANANAVIFAIGLSVLYVSVSAWSRPLAGSIVGVVFMAIAAWPFIRSRREP